MFRIITDISIDSKELLMLVETGKGKFGGYKQGLLINSLNETQVEFYICTKCRGVMRNACQLGEEQIQLCENCVGDKEGYQPIVKARQKITELQVNCPLAGRGCGWNAVLSEVEKHLDVCQKFFVECQYECGTVLERCEMNNHCSYECLNRIVCCEHCQAKIVFRKLKQHYKECLEIPLFCPNYCRTSLRRKQTHSHIETDCPNTIVKCRYERFGCREVVKRCRMEGHNKTNEIKHLEMSTLFALHEIGRLNETNSKLSKEVQLLTKKLELHESAISQLKGTLDRDKASPSYPVVLRKMFNVRDVRESEIKWEASPVHFIPQNRLEFDWKSHKMMLLFSHLYEEFIPVYIYNTTISLLEDVFFEGRFKLQ